MSPKDSRQKLCIDSSCICVNINIINFLLQSKLFIVYGDTYLIFLWILDQSVTIKSTKWQQQNIKWVNTQGLGICQTFDMGGFKERGQGHLDPPSNIFF